MNIPIYQVDAFTATPFSGNPAAICPLKRWLPDATMRAIASENNLSETAFFVPTSNGFYIRWFTPTSEVNLCGHATLAAAHVLFNHLGFDHTTILFGSKQHRLSVRRDGNLLTMDFPAQPPSICAVPTAIKKAFTTPPVACLQAEDYLVVFDKSSDILAANPTLSALKTLDLRGVIITAPSDEYANQYANQYDFVSRFFAPKLGINEDPVTGSAHTQLAPYWSTRLGKPLLRAKQLSARGGEVQCEVVDQRVMISGKAVTFMQGVIAL